MKIGIYDVDSTIPNLALMKVSAYHKAAGDSVEMYLPLAIDTYDKIYASKIFNFSSTSGLIPERMIIGGTGWDLYTELPAEIEAMPPDYSLYDYPHNIGFTMRGCRLRCSFCVVPCWRSLASSLLNLASLCQRCHNRHDAKDRQQGIRQRKEIASGQQRLAWN